MNEVPSGYLKQLLALTAAALGGMVTGLATAMGMVELPPTVTEAPAWIPQAQGLMYLSAAGMALAALAWIYIDYWHEVTA